MAGLTASVRSDPTNASAMFATYLDGFVEASQDAHRKWVFLVLEYIIKYSRVDTGRSRSAWLAFPNAYGYDYTRSLPSAPNADPSSMAQGLASGFFTERPYFTEIVNNVQYVEVMNRRFGLFGYGPTSKNSSRGTKLKTVKLSKGLRFEDKIPLFEAFGEATWQRFMDNAKVAYEKKRQFNPGKIPPLVNPPPIGG